MNFRDFTDISLSGRMAYEICCTEDSIICLGENPNDWAYVFECLWDFTSLKDLDRWEELASEIIPDCLTEFKDYDRHEFEFMPKDTFEFLYNLYTNTKNYEIINKLINKVYNLGISHSHSVIIGYGQASLNCIKDFLDFLSKNGLPIISTANFLQYSISEQEGWGKPIDGRKLSRIIK